MNDDLDWAGRVQRLEAEVAGLRRAMSSRAVIEQAKGVLAERMGCSPEDAFGQLSALSQRSNVRLADLAASIVSAIVPVPAKAANRLDGLSDADAHTYQRVSAAAAASTDLRALAAALAGGAADRAAFARIDPDTGRAVEIAAAGTGPGGETAAVAAITSGQPAWESGSDGTGERSAAFPIRLDNHPVGAVTFTWAATSEFAEPERRYLAAIAQLAQRAAVRMWTTDAAPVAPVLDAFFAPGMLLEPIRDRDGIVIDFNIAYLSAHVPNMAGLSRAEQIGRRLLDTYPYLRTSGVFDAYVRVADTGEPWERSVATETVVIEGDPALVTVSRRAVRHGTAVLATWRRVDDEVRRERQMNQMESLGRFGWADWDLADRHTFWSPGFFRVFDRDTARGPETYPRMTSIAVPADRDAAAAAAGRVLAGEPATVEFHIRTADGIRPVRLVAEPLAAEDGQVVRVLAVAQDLTERRRADERMSRVQAQLADQRFQLAAQRDLASALRQVLYPGSVCEVDTEAAKVVGRYAAPDADVPFRGDFCDSTMIGDGHILFAIGDIFGSGARAGEVLARLLYPARALGSAGMSPAAILDVLNGDLLRDEAPPLASLVVGRFCPAAGTITWAQGGHLPPIRLRGGSSSLLERPPGPALGLLPSAAFGEQRLAVEPDDMIVWMTDGMVYERAKPNADPWRELRSKLVQARATAGLDGVLALCEAAGGDEACILTLTAATPNPSASTCGFPGCRD